LVWTVNLYPSADGHRARQRDIAAILRLARHVDELALRAVQYGALRHGDRLRPPPSLQHDPHEQSRQQRMIGIRDLCLRVERTSARVDSRINEVQLSSPRKGAAVGKPDRNRIAVLAALLARGRGKLAGRE